MPFESMHIPSNFLNFIGKIQFSSKALFSISKILVPFFSTRICHLNRSRQRKKRNSFWRGGKKERNEIPEEISILPIYWLRILTPKP